MISFCSLARFSLSGPKCSGILEGSSETEGLRHFESEQEDKGDYAL